ncbi:MAG: hypothetical protein HKN09_04990 [Saprospiraceae bacterium]|nr:hypothetical protein [Saprospiraceae bacterium]
MQDTTMIYHHNEHRDWMSKINFYQDEIKIFQSTLSKVIQAHPDIFSIIDLVHEYRRILLRKLEKLDNMRYQIALHEHQLAKAKDDAENDQLWDHQEVRDRMINFESEFESFKSALRHFASKHIKE